MGLIAVVLGNALAPGDEHGGSQREDNRDSPDNHDQSRIDSSVDELNASARKFSQPPPRLPLLG